MNSLAAVKKREREREHNFRQRYAMVKNVDKVANRHRDLETRKHRTSQNGHQNVCILESWSSTVLNVSH